MGGKWRFGAAAWRRAVNGWTVFSLLAAMAIALPIIVVAASVFAPTGDIWSHLAETVLPRYVANTLQIMIGVGIGVTIGGVGTAWLVSLCDFPGRRFFEWALLLPFAIPAYVIAYAYTGLLEFSGPVQTWLREATGWSGGDYWFPEIRSLTGAILMLVLVLYPYVYLLARSAFLEQSVSTLEVSRTLGCSPLKSMIRVALPLARPSIAAGVALALMEALNDFGTVQFFGIDTFVTGIYRVWLGQGRADAAAQLAAILMLFIFALILAERYSRGRARYHHGPRGYRPLPEYRLRGVRAWLATAFCAVPVVLGFAVPAVALTVWSIETAGIVIDDRFMGMAFNSFMVSGLAALIAVAVAVLLAYGIRLRRNRLLVAATRLAGLGYAIPGAVIAVGIMVPFAWLDNRVDAWTRDVLGFSTGLLLSGTIFALLFAYLVRFLAISLGTVEAGLGRITTHMDDAARTLGKGTAATLWKVHAPIMKGSLLTAGLLVFVDVMKELPATLMIRPFNFDTLAVRTFEYAGDEMLRQAAPSALAIVLVGILPVILLSRAITRSRPGAGPPEREGWVGAPAAAPPQTQELES